MSTPQSNGNGNEVRYSEYDALPSETLQDLDRRLRAAVYAVNRAQGRTIKIVVVQEQQDGA